MRFLFFLLLCSGAAGAQSLSGTVRHAEGFPLSQATIAVYRTGDSVALKYVLSDGVGFFTVSGLPAGPLRVVASFAGLSTKDTVVQAGAVPVALVLEPAGGLAAVTVRQGKALIEVQPDKLVFNVGQGITGAGGDALELLRKAPGVLVDPNDAISMNGKTGVRIYMDGRPSPLSVQELAALLRSLPASEVEAIEIISNPSSRYEAAGNAGIINIRLKRARSMGTNGSLNAGWSVGIYPKYNGSLTLNHRNRQVNIFGSYGVNGSRNESYLNLLRYQADSLFDQRSTTMGRPVGHNVKLGADWLINRRQTLGVLVNGNFSDYAYETRSRTPIAAQANKRVVQTLEAMSTGRRQRSHVSANLNYRFADTAGHVLTVDADGSYYQVEAAMQSDNRYVDERMALRSRSGFSNKTPVRIAFGAVQAVWEQKLGRGRITAGARATLAKTSNRFLFFNTVNGEPLLDSNRSNDFDYTENINAVFGQYNGAVQKWTWQLGLRVEHTASLGDLRARQTGADKTVRREYFSLFPSAGFTYQLHPSHQIGMSYGRRIDRPSYQDLNPFENRIDELTYQKGNPFLQPQFTDNLELRHTYRYKLTTTLGYSDVQDFFAAITDTIEGRRNFITQRNIARQRIYSLSTSLPFTLTKWWSGFASVGVSHNRYRAQFEPGKEIGIDNTVANLYQQHNFTLSKKWTAEVSSFYLSPYVWAGNYECRSIWNLDLGVQCKLMKEQASVKLSVTDVFQRMPWAGTSRLGSLLVVASGGWESRQVRLNFSYRFGNKEVKAARQRATGVEDLNKRVQ